jgi:hypothetical protein
MNAPQGYESWTQEQKDAWAVDGYRVYRDKHKAASPQKAQPIDQRNEPNKIAVETPLPLFPPLPPAAPYPLDALGILSPAARAIERKVQVPPAVAAQAVLSVAALAAQAHADVTLPYGQQRPLALYFATVIGSGDRKSSADNEASWPLATREKTLREAYRDEMKDWRIASAAWGAEKKKIEGDRKLAFDERHERLARLGEERWHALLSRPGTVRRSGNQGIWRAHPLHSRNAGAYGGRRIERTRAARAAHVGGRRGTVEAVFQSR